MLQRYSLWFEAALDGTFIVRFAPEAGIRCVNDCSSYFSVLTLSPLAGSVITTGRE
jgi:hypothetical protein